MTEPWPGWQRLVAAGQLLAALHGVSDDTVKAYVEAQSLSHPPQQTEQEALQAVLDEVGEEIQRLKDALEVDRGDITEEYVPPPQTTELIVDVDNRMVDELEPVERQETSTLIGGPEVEAEISEMQKLLDEQQQARDELADNIEAMKQAFREAHEDDSPEQSVAHEEQLAAAEQLAQQDLADQQEAERQQLQARQVEMQAQQLDMQRE
jgi:hypothetical protein